MELYCIDCNIHNENRLLWSYLSGLNATLVFQTVHLNYYFTWIKSCFLFSFLCIRVRKLKLNDRNLTFCSLTLTVKCKRNEGEGNGTISILHFVALGVLLWKTNCVLVCQGNIESSRFNVTNNVWTHSQEHCVSSRPLLLSLSINLAFLMPNMKFHYCTNQIKLILTV